MPNRPVSYQSRLERLEVLYRISNIINTTREPDKVLKAILKEVVRITGATSGTVSMLDEQAGVLDIATAINIPAARWRSLKLHLGVGVTGWVAYKGEPLRVEDVRTDSHYVAIRPDVRSEMAVPLKVRGRLIGVLNVDSTRRAAFTEEDERLLVSVADQAAKVIETARLYDEQRRQAARMEGLFELGTQLIRRAPLDEVIALAVAKARAMVGGHLAVLLSISDDGGTMALRACDGRDLKAAAVPPAKVAGSVLEPVVERGAHTAIADMRVRPFKFLRALKGSETYQSMLAVPVRFENKTQAVLVALWRTPRSFAERDIQLMQLLANQCAIAIENAWRQEQIMTMEDNLHRAERFSLLGTLAAEIAHEIRNPVTIINLLIDSIHEELGAQSQAAGDLAIVREKLDRIERIIEQTLNIARDREPVRETYDINALVGDLRMFMDYKLAKAGLEVRTSLAEGLPRLTGDRGQIQQVLLNIVVNAMEAMQPGGRLTIKTEHLPDEAPQGAIVLSVSDSGKGIPKEEARAIFEPFYTTRKEGTGLGLFISNKLVAAHGGRIELESRAGRGTTFRVHLPLGYTAPKLPPSNGSSGAKHEAPAKA